MACRTTAIRGGYVGNNPVNWVDPWGLSPIDEQKNGLTRDQILDTIQTALNMASRIWSDTIKVQCQNCRKREEERQ